MIVRVASVFALLCLAACAAPAIGIKSDDSAVQLIVGQTSKAEVLKSFGLPQQIDRDSAGNEHFYYEPTAKLLGLCIACGDSTAASGLAAGAAIHASKENARRNRSELVFNSSGILIAEYPAKPK
jgi:hypothetical protein